MNTTYDTGDRLVLTRMPKERVRERDAEFLVRIEPNATLFGHITYRIEALSFQTPAQFLARTSPTANNAAELSH